MKEIKLNLKPLIKELDTQLKKGLSHEPMAGDYRSVFKGRGLEFEGYRDYNPEDDATMIDWKATLRAKRLVVRELREERNLSVLFLFDVSNSMLYASTEKLKCEYAAELIATLSYAIREVGDAVGLVMFNDKIPEKILICSDLLP